MNKWLFIKEADFAEYAKDQVVKDYNNPYVKDVAGIDTHIIPTDECIVFKKMSKDDVEYYIGKVNEEVYEGSTTILGWFPTELVCGIIGSRFWQDTELAQKTGWLQTNGMFGSKNDAFLASKVNVAAEILKEVGFNVRFE